MTIAFKKYERTHFSNLITAHHDSVKCKLFLFSLNMEYSDVWDTKKEALNCDQF